MSRAILSIVDKIRARWAWHTAWEDTPEHDVQRNSVTGAYRWRMAVPLLADANPWLPGKPPVQTAAEEIEGLIKEITLDGAPKPVGPIRTYGRATASGIKEGTQVMSDGSREPILVYVTPNRTRGPNLLKEAMRRASESMRMEISDRADEPVQTEINTEGPHPHFLGVYANAGGTYSTTKDLNHPRAFRSGLSRDDVMDMISHMGRLK